MPSLQYRDKVFSFADLYFQQTGKVPSQRMVITACGGSYRDVGPVLAQWRDETPATEGADIDFPIAAELEADVQASIKRWMRRLTAQVEDSIRSDRLESAEAKIADLEAELADYQRLKGQMQGITESVFVLRQHLEAVIRENERLAHYGPQIDQVEQISNECDLLGATVQEQAEEINRQKSQIEHQKEQIEALSRQLGELTGRNTQLEAEASQLRVANAVMATKDEQIKELREQVRFLEQRQPTQFGYLEPIVVDQNVDLLVQERDKLATQVASLSQKVEQLEQEKYLSSLKVPPEAIQSETVCEGNGHVTVDSAEVSTPTNAVSRLTISELAKRFGCAESTVRLRTKNSKDLLEWSAIKDPDRTSWQFDPLTKLFYSSATTTTTKLSS